MSTVGERLRSERERVGKSQTEFGEIGGVSKKSQGNYESDLRSPDALYLNKIESTGADIFYIVTGKNILPYDERMLAICMEAADAMIKEMGVELPADKRAQIVSLLYKEYGAEEEPKIDGDKVVRLIQLAS